MRKFAVLYECQYFSKSFRSQVENSWILKVPKPLYENQYF
jgi:hypothetical protein